MGKNDGMFTTERYVREYLSKVGTFASPQDIFKPSAESSQEEIYHSPLVEGEPAGPRPSAPPRKPDQARGTAVQGSQAYLDFGAGIGGHDLHGGIGSGQSPSRAGGNGERAVSAISRDGAFDHLYSQSIDEGEKGGSHLIIDEKASIDELIAQISNFGRPKA